MKKLFLIIMILFLVSTISGCVRRIVTIDSNPQGAEVYLGRKLIGKTPCTHEFLYYGTYYLELVKQGYANINTSIKLKGPFYQYFPFYVISELVIPWQITDKHNFNFKLEKGKSEKPIISPIEEPQAPLPAPRLERMQER
jgi:hypothetical protein